jgi:hypothetical protein
MTAATGETQAMRLNDDFTVPVLVHGAGLPWVPSPSAGVERRLFFRIGGEVARATSLVRYAPGSAFARHTHGGGEEILVLDGVFQDEHGDYPAGSYFRNPPGTSHVPASAAGCTIFVRLWQFRADDAALLVRRPPAQGLLFDDGAERVWIEALGPQQRVVLPNKRGLELLLVSGTATLGGDMAGSERLAAQSWGRFPAGLDITLQAGAEGARLWLKDAPALHAQMSQLPASA